MDFINDFDFLVGTWDVTNRWRTDFLDEASDWEEFPAVSHATRHFDGGASFDEITFPTKGFAGLTLRLYDRERGEWSLYWASARTGTLFPPVVGRFSGGRGGVLRGRHSCGQGDPRAFHLVGHHRGVRPLGAGVLRGRREDLGDQLDHGVRPPPLT